MDARLLALVDEVVRRTRTLQARRSAVAVWCLAAVQLLVAGPFIHGVPGILMSAYVSAGIIAFFGIWLAYRSRQIADADRLDAARLIEASRPELKQRLLTILEQRPDPTTGQFNALQRMLQHEVVSQAEVGNWSECVPSTALKSSRNRALIAMLTCLALAAFLGRSTSTHLLAQEGDPEATASNPIAESGPVTTVTVEPGTTEVERGSNVLVLARFTGPLPANVSLLKEPASAVVVKTTEPAAVVTATSQVTSDSTEAQVTRFEMSKSLDDPVFGARIANVDKPFRYRVAFDNGQSETYDVAVFEYPKVERIDARIDFPAYTSLPPEEIPDTWIISAVEGATATLVCSLNKPIAQGKLVSEDGSQSFPLMNAPATATTSADAAQTPAAHRMQVRVPISRSMKLHFELQDDRGRANRELGEVRITARPNRPADIAITFPAKDLKVSPLEEMQLEATVFDDFGVKDHGLILVVSDRDPATISLGKEAPAKQKTAVKHLVELELAKVEPDQLVSYYFFADDIAADGKTRRTMSDMFFAEVRHFEEIFRQDQQQPNQSQQQQQQQKEDSPQANQAAKLAESQKQIINATWKIIRREINSELTSAFASDVKQLLEAEQKAIEQLQQLIEELSDPQSKKFAEIARTGMVGADSHFQVAIETPDRRALTPAMNSARTAYEALLKLQAREHLIQQKQSGGGQSSSSAAGLSQQQLNQLELDQKKNRYEAERKAGQQSPKAAQNREQLQVLNRLRELSQRQSDVNQKLQELESALRAAKDEATQEELRRQLKRLSDEQRDLLKNVDELRERMDKPENQQQMAESRQQLEETRSQVRQTSDALENGKLSQALNSGTRAERELQELRDDFRQKAAGQFDDALKELRREARELTQKQQEIAQALQDPNAPPKDGQNPSASNTPDKDPKSNNSNANTPNSNSKNDGSKNDGSKPEPKSGTNQKDANAHGTKPSSAADGSKPMPRRSLRAPTDNRQNLADDLKQQRDQLDRVMEQARQIVEQAESSEPVLAKELYETVRKSFSDRPGEALDVTRELLKRGLMKEARQTEEVANKGIENLQQGIDRASKLVLGDELEALKRAREQVRQLKGSVAEELAQNSPKGSGKPRNDEANPDGKSPTGQAQPGEPQPGQKGQQPNGDSKEGQQPNGQASKGQPGQQPGQQGEPNGKGQPDGKPDSSGQQPGKGQPGQPMGQQPGGQQPGGQQPGSPMSSEGQPSGQQAGNQPNGGRRSLTTRKGNLNGRGATSGGGDETSGGEETAAAGPANPITGQGFNEFSDQLREAEELVTDPKLRADIARVREMARSMRVDFKRHSKAPEWDSVRMQILQPLAEIERRIAEEIARQQSPDSLVPLDKDPVPDRYSELVRKYYERLSQGK